MVADYNFAGKRRTPGHYQTRHRRVFTNASPKSGSAAATADGHGRRYLACVHRVEAATRRERTRTDAARRIGRFQPAFPGAGGFVKRLRIALNRRSTIQQSRDQAISDENSVYAWGSWPFWSGGSRS